MNADRMTARVVGVLFIIGTVAGAACQVVTEPIRDAQDALISVSVNETPIILVHRGINVPAARLPEPCLCRSI